MPAAATKPLLPGGFSEFDGSAALAVFAVFFARSYCSGRLNQRFFLDLLRQAHFPPHYIDSIPLELECVINPGEPVFNARQVNDTASQICEEERDPLEAIIVFKDWLLICYLKAVVSGKYAPPDDPLLKRLAGRR